MTNHQNFKNTIGFVDLLFNLLLGFVFLFLIAFISINPLAEKEIFDPKAEYLIVMNWNKDSENDIDLWIKDDRGGIVSFRNKEFNLVNLDRDDRGKRNDTLIKDDNKQEEILINREVLSIRSKSPRSFIVTVQFYSLDIMGSPNPMSTQNKNTPEEITVEFIRVNPYEILSTKTVTLEMARQEKNVFAFDIKEDGSVEFRDSDELIATDNKAPVIEMF